MTDPTSTEIAIVNAWDNPDVPFDDKGTPILQWISGGPSEANGWQLFYLDDDGEPASTPMAGDWNDVEFAREQALRWLAHREANG